jgi:hypothetical protein
MNYYNLTMRFLTAAADRCPVPELFVSSGPFAVLLSGKLFVVQPFQCCDNYLSNSG